MAGMPLGSCCFTGARKREWEGKTRRGQNPLISAQFTAISGDWAPSPGNMHYCTQHIQEQFFNQRPFTEVDDEGERYGFLPENGPHTPFKGSKVQVLEFYLDSMILMFWDFTNINVCNLCIWDTGLLSVSD